MARIEEKAGVGICEGHAEFADLPVKGGLALVAAISHGLLKRGAPLARNGQQRRNHVAILHVAR